MPSQTTFPGDIAANGAIYTTGLYSTGATITNAMVSGSAAIAASKLVKTFAIPVRQYGTTAVVAQTDDIMIMTSTGTIVSMEAAITGTIATGADRTVTVDLHKSTGAGAFSTVCSATIGFTNASVLRTLASAAFSSTSLVDGDILRVVVTVAGAAGNQALGLIVTTIINQDP